MGAGRHPGAAGGTSDWNLVKARRLIRASYGIASEGISWREAVVSHFIAQARKTSLAQAQCNVLAEYGGVSVAGTYHVSMAPPCCDALAFCLAWQARRSR